MGIGVILAIVLGSIIIIGGPIVAHYAEKASAKAEEASKKGSADKAR